MNAPLPAQPVLMVSKCDQSCKQVSNVGHLSLGAQSRDCKIRQGPGHVMTHIQEPKKRPLSMVSTFSAADRSHQRRWSADFSKCGTSPVITVRKNRKEPQPPQRRVSLQTNTASHPSVKRYSCPPMGVYSSLSRPYSSSSSSSSSTCSCSCSSPPPVQTSIITGHDPLGWKLHPKSSSTSPEVRTKRLSLQIPIPVIYPDPKTSPAPDAQSDTTPNHNRTTETKPPLRPKPTRRRHSDSSALLRSVATPLPVVALEELCAVHLRAVTLSDEPDDVFSGGIEEEEVEVTSRPRRRTPPPVPEKTFMARQIAQLIANSRRSCATKEENIYASVIKPKPKHSHQTAEHVRGLRVDSSCDRERPTPRFPG